MSSTTDVAVIGGGAIGAAVAWRCAQRGLRVVVADPNPERGAWHTAAGMLAPVTELHYTETPLLHLGLAAAARMPELADELAEAAGTSIGYRASGTVAVAWDAADLAALRDLQGFATSLGLGATMLRAGELRALEPSLAPGLPGGLLAEGDHQVDPRALHAALCTAARREGVRFITGAAAVQLAAGVVTGITAGEHSVRAGVTVLAAGAWSGRVAGVPAAARPPVRPVAGQTLRLRGDVPLTRVVRGTVAGNPVYVVPRGDGRIVVGATSEEVGFTDQARAGAVYELLRDAQTLLPELGECSLDEVCTGLRPGSPDNAPLVGPSGVEGLVLATGHHRNGVLLADATATAVAQLLTQGSLPPEFMPFVPGRTRALAAEAVR
jgi:glycine oxidase